MFFRKPFFSQNFLNISYMLKKELFRKTIHIMSSFVPFFYYIAPQTVLVALLFVSILYLASEVLRQNNINIPLISKVTELASRTRDNGKIVLGPITLCAGIFTAFTFFEYRIATIAVFALSFGDGVASLIGKTLQGPKIPFTFGKTFSGSIGCFLFLTLIYCTCGLRFSQALMLAFCASLIEIFPTGDYDNLLIPLGVGLIAQNFII
ncbi:MAG: phosphatidate cytidylyltransferase [Spirochaetales bacterium]|nr:phosphatidate cytidylyltransferase [Spirochaetales bacterium]